MSDGKGTVSPPQGTRCPWTCPPFITTARCCGTPCPSWGTASMGTSSRTARRSGGWGSSDTTSQVTRGDVRHLGSGARCLRGRCPWSQEPSTWLPHSRGCTSDGFRASRGRVSTLRTPVPGHRPGLPLDSRAGTGRNWSLAGCRCVGTPAAQTNSLAEFEKCHLSGQCPLQFAFGQICIKLN